MESDVQTRTATADGTPIRWLEQGTGTPVVLVHGITPEDHPDVVAGEIRSLTAEVAAR